jgi:hypothetical protein
VFTAHPRLIFYPALHLRQLSRSKFILSSLPEHPSSQEKPMSPSSHERIVELHNLAAHAHSAAATAHGKGDHLSAHELSRQAHEHSVNAHKLSEELAKK